VQTAESRCRDQECAGSDKCVVQRPQGQVEVLDTHPVVLAPCRQVHILNRRFDIECWQPVDAVDRSFCQPAFELLFERFGGGWFVDHQRADTALLQPVEQRLADPAAIHHHDDARVAVECDAGWFAQIDGRTQRRHNDAARNHIGVLDRSERHRWSGCGCRSGRCSRSSDRCNRGRWRLSRRLEVGSAVIDEVDHVAQGRIVAQFQVLDALDAERLADGGEGFRLLDGINPQVSLKIEVEFEHLRRVAGLLRHDRQHLRSDRVCRNRCCCCRVQALPQQPLRAGPPVQTSARRSA
jgi:hypothetical protein